jgi:thiamine kinase-like enzyme
LSLSLLVARKLAEYHSIPTDDQSLNKKSKLVEKLFHYLNLLNGKNPQLRERLQSIEAPKMGVLGTLKTAISLQSNSPSLDSLESHLEYSWSQLFDDIKEIESTFDRDWINVPVVFCHNDTQSRSFLLDKQTNTIRIIDFEHCMHNFYLFDIANYFIEFAGLGSSPDWTKKYPSREQRKVFLDEYLKHAHFVSHPNRDGVLEKLCDQCHRLVALTHLYWSLWALLEALVNHGALSQFDYVTYAKNHFNQYKLGKDNFFAS